MRGFTYLPHAREQMALRGISPEEVEEAVTTPDDSYIGRYGRTVAHKDFGPRILRVVYNEGEDEVVVITAVPIRKR